MQNKKRKFVRNNSFFTKIHKILLILMIGIPVEARAPTSTSVRSTKLANYAVVGAIILGIFCIAGICGLILGYRNFKARKYRKGQKDYETMPRLDNPYPFSLTTNRYEDRKDSETTTDNPFPFSEQSTTIQSYSAENRDFVSNNEYNEGTYMGETHNKNLQNIINVKPQQNYNWNWNPAIQQISPVKKHYSVPLPNNMKNFDINNSPGEENKIVNFGSKLDLSVKQKGTQTTSDSDILSAPIKEKTNEDSLMHNECKDTRLPKLSFEHNNNTICQATNHDNNSDDSTILDLNVKQKETQTSSDSDILSAPIKEKTNEVSLMYNECKDNNTICQATNHDNNSDDSTILDLNVKQKETQTTSDSDILSSPIKEKTNEDSLMYNESILPKSLSFEHNNNTNHDNNSDDSTILDLNVKQKEIQTSSDSDILSAPIKEKTNEDSLMYNESILPKSLSFEHNNNTNHDNNSDDSTILDLNVKQKETQTSSDSDILSAPIKEKTNEDSLMYNESILPKSLSFEHNNNTNHNNNSDDLLSSTQSFGLTFSHNESNIIQFEANKDQNNLSQLLLLNDVPRDLPHNIPNELYINKLTIAGQGTIGLKFQAKERFRIVLNSNTDQSYGKTNVIVLDVGEDATYFRKCNNDELGDVLAFTREQKALLDKDMDQLYWFSLDKKNRRLRYGKGPMQSSRTIFHYQFPPQSCQENDEFAWIEKLHYIAISSITFQKKNFIENKPRIELMFSGLPVTMDLPPFIIKHEDSTLEELETGKATVIENLPEECQELYWNIFGTKISLNSPDFPDFADAIEYSIKTPGLACYEKLKEKAGEFGDHDPKMSYLRITLGEDRGNSLSVPYVLEIWPSGHYSPIHCHSNSFGVIKVLYNEIVTRLQPKDQERYCETSFKEGQIIWISDKLYKTHQLWNRTRKVCATIQCYQYGDKNHDRYEYFDYIDNNIIKQFKPNTDWPFAEFKKLIKKEWVRYKYLSGVIN